MLAKTSKQIKKVAFFGDADAKRNDEHFIDAYNTAKLLAENGYCIINGGGPGVMLASTLGAKSAGGRVETVIVNPNNRPANFEGDCYENTSVADKNIAMPNYDKRLNKLVEVADAFVIFKGGTGTLAEVGLTWSKAKFDFGHHEPLIFFGDFWRNIVDTLVVDLDLEKKEQKVYEIVDTPEDILEILNNRHTVKKPAYKKLLSWLGI